MGDQKNTKYADSHVMEFSTILAYPNINKQRTMYFLLFIVFEK